MLVVYTLAHWSRVHAGGAALTAMSFVAVGVAILSLFWATAEYADGRGLQLARKLARDINVSPRAVVYSKVDLGIDPTGPGSGAVGECGPLQVSQSRNSTYRYRYAGFTLLAHSAGKYFVTPTPLEGPWDPSNGAVFILPDDESESSSSAGRRIRKRRSRARSPALLDRRSPAEGPRVERSPAGRTLSW